MHGITDTAFRWEIWESKHIFSATSKAAINGWMLATKEQRSAEQ
jgi:hypothetical protein